MAGQGVLDAPPETDLPDIDWRVPPAGTVRWSVRVPSGRLAALACGRQDRPRVVLAPGITGSKEDFHFLFPVLASAGFRVESCDAAGQYESASAGPEHLPRRHRRWDYELFVDDLIAVLEQGTTPVHLVGHSFQGIVAQLVAVRRPDLVRSLTLLSSPPCVGDALEQVQGWGPLTAMVPAAAVARVVREGILRNVQHVPPGRQRFVTERFRLTRTDAHTASMRLLRHVPDVRRSLRETGIPVLSAVGAQDLWPLELHRRYADDIGAALDLHPGGHSPSETSPYELCGAMLALFEEAAHAPRPRPGPEGGERPGEPTAAQDLLRVGHREGVRGEEDPVPDGVRAHERPAGDGDPEGRVVPDPDAGRQLQ